MKKVVVVGQTPPPFGGQAVMIQRLLEGKYRSVKLIHVRMAFSKEISDMGRFQIGKLLHALSLICQIAYCRVKHRATVIYYPPSGPDYFPMLRDIVVLFCTRWMFKKTIFHFHAAGISEIYPQLSWILKILYRVSFFQPDIAIQLSEFNPDDGGFLSAKKRVIVPNGIGDDFVAFGSPPKRSNAICKILFVGLLTESKGVLILLDAMRYVVERGAHARLSIVGEFESDAFHDLVSQRIASLGLKHCVECPGVLTGRAKYEAYHSADVFCFPTFFESESFGLVVTEAMQFSVPVVVTKWRGVQSLVEEGINGYCVPIHDSEAVGERLVTLIANPDLRERMGAEGRRLFIENYTLEKFHQRMDQCFELI